jgi:hypothetical protein
VVLNLHLRLSFSEGASSASSTMDNLQLHQHERMSKLIVDLWFIITMAGGDLSSSSDEISDLSSKIMEFNNKILASYPATDKEKAGSEESSVDQGVDEEIGDSKSLLTDDDLQAVTEQNPELASKIHHLLKCRKDDATKIVSANRKVVKLIGELQDSRERVLELENTLANDEDTHPNDTNSNDSIATNGANSAIEELKTKLQQTLQENAQLKKSHDDLAKLKNKEARLMELKIKSIQALESDLLSSTAKVNQMEAAMDNIDKNSFRPLPATSAVPANPVLQVSIPVYAQAGVKSGSPNPLVRSGSPNALEITTRRLSFKPSSPMNSPSKSPNSGMARLMENNLRKMREGGNEY